MRFILYILVFTSFLCEAEVYSWVDKNGKRHYSDKRNRDKDAKKIQFKQINPFNSSDHVSSENSNDTEWTYVISDKDRSDVWGIDVHCTEVVKRYIPHTHEMKVYARESGPGSKILKQKTKFRRISENKFKLRDEKALVIYRLSKDKMVMESKRQGQTTWVKEYRCVSPHQDEELIKEIKDAK